MKSKRDLKIGVVAIAAALMCSGAAFAQAPPAPPAQQVASADIGSLIEANIGGGSAGLVKALAPAIIANPELAADVIAYAQAHPEKAELLAEVLATIQVSLKDLDPKKAKILSTVVASAPPAFQAAYAVALAPGDTGGGGGQVASTGGGGATGGGGGGTSGGGTSGGGGFNVGGGSSGGFGGGPVSHN